MLLPLRILLAFTCLFVAFANKPAEAQRGQLVEGLFRTLAEAQLQREQLKRLEAEKQAQRQQADLAREPKLKDPYEVRLPSGFGPAPINRVPIGTVTPRVTVNDGAINVRHREAAKFAENLVRFQQQVDPLISDLRAAASNQPQLRGLMSEAYAVAAETRALLQSCDGVTSLAPIYDPYRSLDSRWRQLSFGLRSVSGLSDRCTTAIRRCDELCAAMCKQLNIQPQFDRHALHDVMITASVYMQALADDLQIAVPSQNHYLKLTHDLRLLQQRLLGEADRVDETSYDEMVERFSEFVIQWREFSNEVYRINNPHLSRRLDRIGECGEQTYHLLWLQPPVSAQDLRETTGRLRQNLEAVLGQLTLRSMVQLKPQDQIRVLQSCRDLYEQSGRLQAKCESNASRDQMRDLFVEIDRGWGAISDTLPQIPSLNRGTIAEIDRACQQLRGGFRIESSYAPANGLGDLVHAAAALEGTAAYLDEQISRYQTSLQPKSFRDSVHDAAHELRHHSKQLHEALDRRGRFNDERYMSGLQADAEHLFEAWNQLAKDLEQIETRGLPTAEAERLRAAQRQAVPFVAEIAAALMQ